MGKTINTILNLQDKFSGKLNEAGKNALIFKTRLQSCEGAAKKVDGILSDMAKTAAAVSAAGVAAMGAFAASAVKTYGEFQQSMSNVAGISGITAMSEDYKKLEQAAREAGKSTTKTAAESADALSYMALAGWTTEQQLKGLMPILRASEATGADLAVTSDLVTDSMSAMGVGVERLTEYLDMAAAANNKSNQNMLQLMEAIIGSGGAARAAGVNMYDLSTALGVLADNGLKGAEGGTAMNSMLVRMTTHDKALKTMKSLGVEVFDANKKFRGLEAILTDLNAAMVGMGDEDITANLKAIAGTNYYSQFKYLLDAAKEGSAKTDEFSTRWKEFNSELHNSKGTLDTVADTMTNNYAGAMARAGSAIDDLKITLGQKLEPYITKFLNWFSEKLPGATEKFASWLDRKLPKAINFCKAAFDLIKIPVAFIINNFSKLASVAAGVVVGLKAFSIITKVVSFMNKLKTAETALKAVQLALNTSMLACPLTWIAVAIGAVVGSILLYKDAIAEAKEEDLAEHFGNIELSAEECSKAIQGIFGQNAYMETDLAKSAYEAAQSSIEELSESSKKLNKLNFKLGLDPESVPKDEYLEIANEYIENMNKALKDQQYALDVGIKLMISDTELAESFGEDAAKFYSLLSKECQGLGTKLKQAIENAYEHNWDFDSSEAVSAILKQQAEIQDKIASAQSEARLETLKFDFANGDLSAESYASLMESAKEEMGKLKEAYNQTRIDTIAGAKLTYGENSAELAKITEEANQTYAQKVSELGAKSISLGGASIVSAYKNEFALAAEQFKILENSTLNQKDVYGFIDKFNKGDMSAEQIEDNLGNIANAAVQSTSISSIQRENIAELYEAMKSEVESMREDVKNLETVPQELQNALLQADFIGAIGGDEASKEHLGAMLVAKSLSPEKAKELFEASEKFGENCPKGIFSDKNIQEGLTAAENYRNIISERLSQPYMIDADVKINFNTKSNFIGPLPFMPEQKMQIATGGVPKTTNKGNATGTPYFGGGLTEINEHGGEIINLPTGAQIIPSDKSAQMVRENAKYRAPNISLFNMPSVSFNDVPYFGANVKKNNTVPQTTYIHNGGDKEIRRFGDINVNVTIGGNIVGIDDFAEEIGGIVGGKFVDAIRAM